jgi:hypothetical protein
MSITGDVSETVTGSDNYFLSHTPIASTYKSLSAINLKFDARTPTTNYLLNTNFSYYKYFGPGAAETFPTSGTPAWAKFTTDHKDKLNTYTFDASWERADVAETLLNESGVVTGHGHSDTYVAGGSVTHQVSRTDSIQWLAHAKTVTFSSSNGTPYWDFTTGGIWKHAFSRTTEWTTSVNFDWFTADDPANSERVFWQIMTGLKSQLSQRLTFTGAVGVGLVNAWHNGQVQSTNSFITAPPQFQAGAASSFLANADLTYQLLKNTSVSLTAARSITPTVLGQLQESSAIGFIVHHDINHLSNLTLSASYSHSKLAGVPYDFFTASASYGYKLTRDWRTNLSYTFRQRDDDIGTATSHMVTFGVVKDLSIMP